MSQKNIYGSKLGLCHPNTGYTRTGTCTHSPEDMGNHIVCAIMTNKFLAFTKSRGNDLITPRPNFAGLKEGDLWCICAHRWLEAFNANPAFAPYIVGNATSEKFLKFIPYDILKKYLRSG